VVANSDGVFASDHQVRTRFNISCIATGDTGCRRATGRSAGTRGFEHADPRGGRDARAARLRQAITKLDARPAPSGDLPVVLAGGSGDLVPRGLRHGLEADAVLKQASVYAGKVGQQVASPLVTLVDDGRCWANGGTSRSTTEGRPGPATC